MALKRKLAETNGVITKTQSQLDCANEINKQLEKQIDMLEEMVKNNNVKCCNNNSKKTQVVSV